MVEIKIYAEPLTLGQFLKFVGIIYSGGEVKNFLETNSVFVNKMKEQILQAMREFGAPVNAGKIAEITGIDRKEVDKAFAELKKEGAIVSPVRCKWEPAK